MSKVLMSLILSQFVGNLAMSMPAEILLFRHAEKIESEIGLSTKGWKRAKLLPDHIREEYGVPAAVYGMSPKKVGSSIRSLQTVKYVAESFNLEIRDQFTENDVQDLVEEIKEDKSLAGKMVVICWQRDTIKEIARELGVYDPYGWPSEQFDRIWHFKFSTKGKLLSFEDYPQNLLPNDSN